MEMHESITLLFIWNSIHTQTNCDLLKPEANVHLRHVGSSTPTNSPTLGIACTAAVELLWVFTATTPGVLEPFRCWVWEAESYLWPSTLSFRHQEMETSLKRLKRWGASAERWKWHRSKKWRVAAKRSWGVKAIMQGRQSESGGMNTVEGEKGWAYRGVRNVEAGTVLAARGELFRERETSSHKDVDVQRQNGL